MGYYTSKLLSQVQSSIPQIGDLYGGGKVAYILQVGDPGYEAGKIKGLIISTSIVSTNIAWITGGSTQTTLNGNTSALIGTGYSNTIAMAAQSGYTGGAAKKCLDYRGGDYSDWFLPSENELTKIVINILLTGDLYGYYWSSTENASIFARRLQKSNKTWGNSEKNQPLGVYAVRYFMI